MKIVVRKSFYKEFIKSFGVKYKSKKLINGKWRYYYADKREKSVKWHEHNATKQELRTFIHDTITNPNYEENIKLCDIPSHFSDKLKLKLGIKINSLTMGSSELRHSLNQTKHNITSEDILLFRRTIQNKHTIIRYEGTSKRRKSNLIKFKGYSRGTIYFIATYNKYGELKLFDCYREGKIEKSVRPLCTCPEANALDDSQPILIVSLI